MSQADLAKRSRLSLATIKAYEAGTRHPTRANLQAALTTLHASRAESNEALLSAGFAPVEPLGVPEGARAYYSLDSLEELISRYQWPVFGVDDRGDLAVVNTPFQALFGVDLTQEYTRPAERNLLALATTKRFAEHFDNWDELVKILISTWLGSWYQPASVEEPRPHFGHVVDEFFEGDPAYVARGTSLWAGTDLIPNRKRWDYPVAWRDDEVGPVRFVAVVLTGDDPRVPVSINDWIPADAASWQAMDVINARWHGRHS